MAGQHCPSWVGAMGCAKARTSTWTCATGRGWGYWITVLQRMVPQALSGVPLCPCRRMLQLQQDRPVHELMPPAATRQGPGLMGCACVISIKARCSPPRWSPFSSFLPVVDPLSSYYIPALPVPNTSPSYSQSLVDIQLLLALLQQSFASCIQHLFV
jgi:hypothetical protein